MNALGILFAVSAETLILALGHLNTGLNYYRDGKQEKALREFAVVLMDYRDTPVADDALYWSAKAYEARGDKEKAASALEELAKSFPQSPYLSASTAAAPVPPPAAPAPDAAPAVAAAPKPPTNAPILVAVKKAMEGNTVVEMNGKSYRDTAEFEKALAELKKARPDVVVVFRRQFDVDLQMVMDVVNAFDKLQVTYRLQ